MSHGLHIISSCSDGKRGTASEALCLRSHHSGMLEDRFASWWSALRRERAQAPFFPAEELYVGDHWAVSRDLPALGRAQGFQSHLWVISAGYGLIPATASILPYAATFQPRHADSISHRADSAQRIREQQHWWRLLCASPGPDESAPHSLTSLVRSQPTAQILLIASPQYLHAIAEDLAAALPAFRETGGLVIVSSEVKGLPPELLARCVTSNARFQAMVQGSRLSLHARVARWLIQTAEQHRFHMPAINRLVEDYLRTAPQLVKYDRAPVTDDRVRAFIRGRATAGDSTSHTRLLREWRSAGQACEQGRFRRLYLEVQETLR